MKFNFWKKDKKPPKEETTGNKTLNKGDDSIFYDYDKVAHNQFLTNDEIKGKYFDSSLYDVNEARQSEYYKKYHSLKNKIMSDDEKTFNEINNEINSSINSNHHEYMKLNDSVNDILVNDKIPIKKKSLFAKRNDYDHGSNLIDNINSYNIVENNTNKYENSVDYYSLKKEQTKLLNLDDIVDNQSPSVKEEPVIEKEDNSFYVDKKMMGDLTNRLFVSDINEQDDNTVEQNNNIEDKKESNTIPRKTIRLAFDNTASLSSLQDVKNNQINKVINNNANDTRLPTTALRYLTPVEEDEENTRVKKEERRFIKFKG